MTGRMLQSVPGPLKYAGSLLVNQTSKFISNSIERFGSLTTPLSHAMRVETSMTHLETLLALTIAINMKYDSGRCLLLVKEVK